MEPRRVPQGKLRFVSTACLIVSCVCSAMLLSMHTTAQPLQAWQKVLAQWESLENAKERTFKYWLYRWERFLHALTLLASAAGLDGISQAICCAVPLHTQCSTVLQACSSSPCTGGARGDIPKIRSEDLVQCCKAVNTDRWPAIHLHQAPHIVVQCPRTWSSCASSTQ